MSRNSEIQASPTPAACRSIVLRSRPDGAATLDNFEITQQKIPTPADGEVLTRTLWLSIDPYMRGRMDAAKSYASSVKLGEPMTGETVGEVVESRHPDFKPGEIVLGARGWQTHIVSPGEALTLIGDEAPYSAHLGVLGMPGATAFAGLRDIGQPQVNETVVVSAAAGAVGSVVVQLAKRAGARVVGIAGGAQKTNYVRDELGADFCIDHRGVPDLPAALRQACPNGIDVYFENVGGALQRGSLSPAERFRSHGHVRHGRGIQRRRSRPGPNLGATFKKRLRIQGFLVRDRPENLPDWRHFATPLVVAGTLKHQEQIVAGLDSAPAALLTVLNGRNEAKMLVRVAERSQPARANTENPLGLRRAINQNPIHKGHLS